MILSANVLFKKNNLLVSQLKGVNVELKAESNSFSFSIEFIEKVTLAEVFVQFNLEEEIFWCRTSSYEWKKPAPSHPWVANTHSPKILKSSGESVIVGGSTHGCWELDTDAKTLRWYFIHPQLSPLMTYDSEDRRHFLKEQEIAAGEKIEDRIFWSKGTVEEWARTPLGFLPIVCFTDHSDFDTLENLEVLRGFFKNLGIRVTKGFFLHDYTHKKSNASFEDPSSRKELISWDKDGHELVYHAFSQSYRGEQSQREFQEFSSPDSLKPITTYIDHGFHPYNFTKQPLGDWKKWYSHMQGKGISLIWSYLDSGEGNLFAINQLNPQSFTLRNIIKSSKLEKKSGIFRSRYSTLRNLIMFGVPEEIFWASKYFKGSLFALRRKPSISQAKQVLEKGGAMLKSIFLSGLLNNFNSRLDQTFYQSRFAPLFFKSSNQNETQIWVFQTLFVRDFDVVFSENALSRLLEEKGAFIAHTYFTYANPGHEGRLFEDETWFIRPEARLAFERLSKLIQSGKIWNPTLGEMKAFFEKIDRLHYQLEEGNLVIKNFDGKTRHLQ